MMNLLPATLGPFTTVGTQGDGDDSMGGIQQQYIMQVGLSRYVNPLTLYIKQPEGLTKRWSRLCYLMTLKQRG